MQIWREASLSFCICRTLCLLHGDTARVAAGQITVSWQIQGMNRNLGDGFQGFTALSLNLYVVPEVPEFLICNIVN